MMVVTRLVLVGVCVSEVWVGGGGTEPTPTPHACKTLSVTRLDGLPKNLI